MTNQALVELCVTLPGLGALAQKVASVHGNTDPRLNQVSDVFRDTSKHLHALAQAPGTPAPADLAADLKQLRELTDDFAVPSHACGSYRGLLAGLTHVDEVASTLL